MVAALPRDGGNGESGPLSVIMSLCTSLQTKTPPFLRTTGFLFFKL
jgi:hypothetical protein